MKRTDFLILLTLTLGCCIIGGCGTYAETSMVHPKNAASAERINTESAFANIPDKTHSTDSADSSYEKMPVSNASNSNKTALTDDTRSLRSLLGAPEHVKSSLQNESGNLQVDIDASVEIPEVSSIPSVPVSEHRITQADIDRITETIFPEATFYTSQSYHQMTKRDIQSTINQLEQYLAEGNTDPYAYGWTEFDMRQSIADKKQLMNQSLEEKNLIEVPALLGSKSSGPIPEDEMYIVAVTSDGTAYNYSVMNFMGHKIRIEKYRPEEDRSITWNWMECQTIRGIRHNVPTEDTLQKSVGITLEDAQKTAEEILVQIGLTDTALRSWDYALLLPEETTGQSSGVPKDVGYILHYTRDVNGIPITYTDSTSRSFHAAGDRSETWDYEVIDFLITKEGIEQVCIDNLYDIDLKQIENLTLLPFSDIVSIFEKILPVQNSFVDECDMTREYRINRITLGYSRICDPATGSHTGTLIPVWDFFGEYTDTAENISVGKKTYTNYSKTRSYLTINAVDGSVVEKGTAESPSSRNCQITERQWRIRAI